jgi:hypothetical protein
VCITIVFLTQLVQIQIQGPQELHTDPKDALDGESAFLNYHLKMRQVIVENHKAGAGEQDTVQDTKINLKCGTYVLHFDNTYSMMTGKSFSYAIDVGGGEQSPLPTGGEYSSFGS